MNYDVLRQKVEDGLSQRAIASALGVGHTAVRHWLKKFELETKPASAKRAAHHDNCVLCSKPTVCGRRFCASCWTRVRRCRAKLLGIKMLGGKCVKCGWSGHPAAFEFHHVRGKDFAIGSAANKSWAVVRRELKKCELLCSNCHRIEHSRSSEPELIAEAEKFMRKGFCLFSSASRALH